MKIKKLKIYFILLILIVLVSACSSNTPVKSEKNYFDTLSGALNDAKKLNTESKDKAVEQKKIIEDSKEE